MKLTRRRFLWTAAGVGGASLVVGWTVFGDTSLPLKLV